MRAAGTCALQVTTSPPGATVHQDGKATGGVTPARLAVTPGEHHLLLERRGDLSVARSFSCGSRERAAVVVTATLPARPSLPSRERFTAQVLGGSDAHLDATRAALDVHSLLVLRFERTGREEGAWYRACAGADPSGPSRCVPGRLTLQGPEAIQAAVNAVSADLQPPGPRGRSTPAGGSGQRWGWP